jgi:DnaJ-class molecular chaperone
MLERALSAFEALPAPLDPWQILGLRSDACEAAIKAAHLALTKQHHPDVGGSTAKMAELNRARDLALEALRKTG